MHYMVHMQAKAPYIGVETEVMLHSSYSSMDLKLYLLIPNLSFPLTLVVVYLGKESEEI